MRGCCWLSSRSDSNVDGDTSYVRVQVLTNSGASIARSLSQSSSSGWGLAGHANVNDELVGLARAQIAQVKERQGAR
jgi:hypothetical protein